MFPKVCGDQTGEQYSNKGRTYVKNAFVKMALPLDVKLLRIILALIVCFMNSGCSDSY